MSEQTWQARDVAQHRLLFDAEVVVRPRQDLVVCATDWELLVRHLLPPFLV